MARNGTDQIVKKNSKLETFLKRNLDVDSYEKIRAYDSCIVCSEKEDKAFKYIILTDEWIYLSENPPKKLYETVHLKDLVSIELVNDYPKFLQGEEQQNVQHLVVKYLSNDPPKGKKSKSARKEKGDTLEKSARTMTPRSARTLPVNPIVRPYATHSLSARENKEMKLQTARDIIAELRAEETQQNLNGTETIQSEKHVQFGSSLLMVPPQSKSSFKSMSPILKRKTTDETKSEPSGESTKKKKDKSKKDRDSDSQSLNGTGSKLTPRTKGELKLDLTQLQTSEDDEEGDEDLKDENSNSLKKAGDSVEVVSSNKGLCGKPKKRFVTPREDSEDEFIITLRDGSTITMDYLIPSTLEESATNSDGDIREVVMHLYIMNARSKILMLIQSAKHNYLIRGTLEEDPKYVVKTTFVTPRSVQASSDKLEYLLRQLRTELQYSSNTMEDNFYHIHELKVAAERNFALRKLFWKIPDVFRFMVRQLKIYVSMITARMKYCETENDFKIARSDELEYLVLILETLAILLRETEIVPTRILMMKSEAGHITKQLIASLVACPEVPQLSHNISNRVRILNNSTELQLTGTQPDMELQKLLRDYRNVATSVLFELTIIGEQAIWCDSETTLLNVFWIVKQLGEMETVKPFVEHIIAEAMGMISSQCLEPVSPAMAVLLYHQFHILRTLAYFNEEITAFMRDNFFEEFKYYIQASVLLIKLPSYYLLRPKILALMEWVVSEVLQYPVKLTETTL